MYKYVIPRNIIAPGSGKVMELFRSKVSESYLN